MSTVTWSVQAKRDTAANWTSNNPTLLAGQLGWESDTNKLKIGTGTTPWNSLAYFGGSSLAWGTITGTITNQTDLTTYLSTNYVPYTGATSDVDLGAYLLSTKSIRVTGTSGSGDIHLRHQSADATATGQSTSLFADVNGDLKWKNDGNYYTTLKTSTNTANRIYTYPDANGTIALTSDIGTWGALNYPTWVSGTPFVKMTAAGTFALDTNTYQPLDSDLTSWAGVTRASGFDTFTATPSSANLRALLTDENGTGAALFDGATSPTFTTDITTPLIIGGSAAGSTIQYKGTSGNGTSTVAAHEFLVGNNGATSTTKIYNSGQVSIGNYASPTNLRILTIGQDTAYMTFGSIVGATNKCGIYFNTASPSQYNYNIYGDGNTTYINGNSQSIIQASNTNVIVVDYNKVTFSASPMSSGALTAFNFNSPTNTGQTASTNISNFRVNGSSKTWAAGTITNQYWNYFTANTAAFASASTITNSYGLYVEAATAGTNATITNNYAAGFSGNVNILSGNLFNSGTQVLSTRDTGWTAMAGSTDKATSLNTGTLTLSQLAQRVAALQAALTTHGLIGA